MKNLIPVFLFFILLTTACKKDFISKYPPVEYKYVAGDVLIGIKSDADLKVVFNAIDSFNLTIWEMSAFIYDVSLPADSINYLTKLLSKRKYLYADAIYYYDATKSIRISTTEQSMTLANQNNFLNAIDSLHLNDIHSDFKSIYLRVPVGTEKYWVNELKQQSFVSWAELNYLEYLQLN